MGDNKLFLEHREIKIECEIEEVDECLQNVLYQAEIADDMLYKDHIIKEEMVIGPEICPEIEDIDQYDYTSVSDISDCKLKKDKSKNMKAKQQKGKKNVYRCKICDKNFSFACNLRRHIKTVHEKDKVHRCGHCDASFMRNYILIRHIENVHFPKKDERGQKIIAKQNLVCDYCKKLYANKNSLQYHMKHVCPQNENRIKQKCDKLYICDICHKSFIFRNSMKNHVKLHMGNIAKMKRRRNR